MNETIDLVVFRAGGRLFGVEAAQVRESQPAGAAGAEAHDCEALIGVAASPRKAPRLALTIKGETEDWRLAIDAPLELRSVPASSIHPLPDLVAVRTRLRLLRALAYAQDGLVYLLDLRGAAGA
jgi:hypothetical protein